MEVIIIYATILLNGFVNVIEYKGEFFQSNKECVKYLHDYNNHINTTLQEHINKKEKGATVLYIGCSKRDKFTQEGDLT